MNHDIKRDAIRHARTARACINLILLIFCQQVSAHLKPLHDTFDALYDNIQEGLLPGLSITLPDDDDGSDAALIDAATCSYLNWAVSLNRFLRADRDESDSLLSDKNSQKLTALTESRCAFFFTRHDPPTYDFSSLQHVLHGWPDAPVDAFINAAGLCFSPLGSYVQDTPSYCEWEVGDETADTRERIVIELILRYLGFTMKEAGIKEAYMNDWAAHYRARVEQSITSNDIPGADDSMTERVRRLKSYALDGLENNRTLTVPLRWLVIQLLN